MYEVGGVEDCLASFKSDIGNIKQSQIPTPTSTPQNASQNGQRKKVTKEERRHLAELKGFAYLQEVMPQLESKQAGTISFDLYSFCSELKFTPFKINASFDNTLAYAEEFFPKIKEPPADDELAEEVNSAMTAFRKFVVASKKKEGTMVNAVFDLKDTIEELAELKSQLELERFAQDYLDGKDLTTFHYALDVINEHTRPLAECLCKMKPPVYIQNMAKTEHIVKLAEECGKQKLAHITYNKLIEIAQSIITDPEELIKFKTCTAVVETGECIDICRYLELFAHNDSEHDLIQDTYSKFYNSRRYDVE